MNHARATRTAQNIIKLENLIDHDYNIEVSSPGINRPLFNLKDFIKFQGEKINVELKKKINNKKRFTGPYSVINEIVFLNDNDTTKISIEDIKANLIRDKSMNKEILLIIDTVSNEKNVDREIIIDAMEHALASAVKKKYKLDQNTRRNRCSSNYQSR